MITFIFPTRGRDKIFRKQLENLYNKLSNKHQYEVCVTFDSDDKTMNNPQMIAYLNSKPNLKWQKGESKSKIHAINRGTNIMSSNMSVLVLLSDDFTIIEQDFDQTIVKDMEKFAKGQKHALNYNDGYRHNQNLCTLSIMNRKLYDYFGYIYWPEYLVENCDDEFTLICRQQKCMTDIPKVIARHDWAKDEKGKSMKDQTFKKNAKNVPHDRQLFKKRKQKGFPRNK